MAILLLYIISKDRDFAHPQIISKYQLVRIYFKHTGSLSSNRQDPMNSRNPFGAYALGQDAGMQFAPLTSPRCHHQTYARRDIIY